MKNQKQGYNKTTVFIMLTALLSTPMVANLRTIQKDELKILDIKDTKKIQLTSNERNYITTLYQNFVLNDFRFDDKSKDWTVPTKIKKVEVPLHIGIQMLNNLKVKSIQNCSHLKDCAFPNCSCK